MTLPFPLPDWLPWWVPLVLLVPALLYLLAFLFMPFSVIGLKGRMDSLEAKLDDIQQEIRSLVLRLPDSATQLDFDELYSPEPPATPRRDPPIVRPPIPPAAHELERGAPQADRPAPPPNARPPSRREPRLDWPR